MEQTIHLGSFITYSNERSIVGNTVSHSLLAQLRSINQFKRGRPNWVVEQIKHHIRIHFNSWILLSTLGPVSCDFPWYRKLTSSENLPHICLPMGHWSMQTSSIITSIRCHLFYQRIMESCVLGSQALRPPVMMSTKPIKSASRVVPSHAGRYTQNSVTRYWSLEINLPYRP